MYWCTAFAGALFRHPWSLLVAKTGRALSQPAPTLICYCLVMQIREKHARVSGHAVCTNEEGERVPGVPCARCFYRIVGWQPSPHHFKRFSSRYAVSP